MNMYVGPNKWAEYPPKDTTEKVLSWQDAHLVAEQSQKVGFADKVDRAGVVNSQVVPHDLKCDPACYVALALGHKKAEVRYDDRGYKAGDVLWMRETRYSAAQMRLEGQPLEFTGASCYYRVTHIQRGYGLPSGTCILSVEAC